MASTSSAASAPVPAARQPRGLVKIAGTVYPSWVSWEVDNNTHYQADTFRSVLKMGDAGSAFDPAWWSAEPKIPIEIFAGFPSNPSSFSASDLTSIFAGNIEDMDIDLDRNLVSVNGRDLTALLIDTKSSQKYANLTSSQIATQLAQKHGLMPVVTPTATKVGRYYTQDLVRLQDDRPEWDLLTFLAREEDFDVFVQGQSLFFQPKATASTPGRTWTWSPRTASRPYATFSGQRVKLMRNLNLAKDITVQVISWNQKAKRAFTKTAKATHTKSRVLKQNQQAVTDQQIYTYRVANLTPAQGQARANQILAQLSAHELKVEIAGPADNNLSVRDTITLAGSGTAFDQLFYPDSIIRSMSFDGPYAWTIGAKNHSPESEPDL